MKALVLLALVGMVVLSVPSVRDQVEQQFYPRKYQALVEQWAQVYQLTRGWSTRLSARRAGLTRLPPLP